MLSPKAIGSIEEPRRPAAIRPIQVFARHRAQQQSQNGSLLRERSLFAFHGAAIAHGGLSMFPCYSVQKTPEFVVPRGFALTLFLDTFPTIFPPASGTASAV